LAFLQLQGSPGNYQLTTLLSQGNGAFAPFARYPVFPDTFFRDGDFILADFRNTGHPDFVAIGLSSDLNSVYPPFLAFAPNNGDGTFGAPTITNPSTANQIMAVGDFNHDGKLDFVAIGNGNPGNVAALNAFLGNGNGTFNPLPSVLFGGSTPRFPASVYAGDFNRDGKLDVLVYLDYNAVPYVANDVYEFLGNGDGTFRTGVKIFSNSDPLTVADVNGDGIADIVTCKDQFANYPSLDQPAIISIYLGQDDGSFSLVHTYHPFAGSITNQSWPGKANAGGGFCKLRSAA
jgi:VCBS repeat protein